MAVKNANPENCFIFDIETGSLPDAELRKQFTFNPEAVKDYNLLGLEFDPASVKTGNLKDPEKKAAKVEAARKEFKDRKEAARNALESAEEEQFAEMKSRAALNATTGRVLAFGFCPFSDPENVTIWHLNQFQTEREFMEKIVDFLTETISSGGVLCGHNIKKFDMPFLIRRAWANKIRVPMHIQQQFRRYETLYYIDTMQVWGDFVSLDTIATLFGTTRKNGNGAFFSDLYFGTDAEYDQSLNYLKNDVQMTWEIAQRMGVTE